MLSLVLALSYALAALVSDGSNAQFTQDILLNCTPILEPGVFMGCEDRRWLPDNDAGYAGIIWIDGVATPQTGP